MEVVEKEDDVGEEEQVVVVCDYVFCVQIEKGVWSEISGVC